MNEQKTLRQVELEKIKRFIKSHGWKAAIHRDKVIWLASFTFRGKVGWERLESSTIRQAKEQLGY
ncbi:hypothetical protein KQI63_05995 [bacterium]|nr:hypothetical protein [bacterium]